MKYVRKGQYGFPVITISPKEYLDKSAEVLLKAIEPVGKAITKFVAAPQHGATSYATTGQYKTKEKAKELKLKEKAFEEHVSPALSPSNHVVAWTQGSWDPRVGLRKIAEWGPLALLASLGVDAIGFKYAPKVVKGTPKAVVDVAAKAGVKPAKAAVVAREINKAVKNKPNVEIPKAETRTRVGDVEINNPLLAYRLGDNLIKDLYNSGIVRTPEGNYALNIIDNGRFTINIGREFSNPMFALGELWYTPGVHSDLLVTAKPLSLANKGSSEVPSKINGTFDVRNYTYKPNRIGVRRVPSEEGEPLTISDVTSYKWIPGYGYKQVVKEPSTSLKFFERKPAKISLAEKAGVTKLERNFTPKRHIAYYPGYQLKGLMKGSPLEKLLSKAGTINVKLLKAHFNKASQIERDIVNQVLEDKVWGDNIDYNKFKKAVQNELITYERKPQTKYSDYGMNRIGYDGDIRVPNNFSGYMEVALYKFPNRFLRKSSTEFIDTETGQSVTPFNFHDYDNTVIASLLKNKVTKNTFTFESPRLPLGNSKHYNTSTLGHSRTYTTPEEPNVLHVLESQSDWGQTKLGNNTAPYTGTTEYLNDPTAYRKFIDGHKRLLAKMLENPSEYLAGAIERQIANIEHHEAILKEMLKQGGWNPLAKYLHDNYLQRQLQENLKYASEHGQTVMRYPTPETAAKIEGYTTKLQWYSPTGERLDMRNLEYDTEIGDFEYPEGSIMKNEYSPQHLTILKKYSDFPKMFQKLFRGHPVDIVTDSKGNTWYLVNVPKGYLNREWQYKKGGKTHKPFGHRSILDNGWQSTKLLKNKKNIYGK